MRKLIVLVLLCIPLTAVGGDPVDGNDTPLRVASDYSDYYCTDTTGTGLTPYQAWMCELAVYLDTNGWWDSPW